MYARIKCIKSNTKFSSFVVVVVVVASAHSFSLLLYFPTHFLLLYLHALGVNAKLMFVNALHADRQTHTHTQAHTAQTYAITDINTIVDIK